MTSIMCAPILASSSPAGACPTAAGAEVRKHLRAWSAGFTSIGRTRGSPSRRRLLRPSRGHGVRGRLHPWLGRAIKSSIAWSTSSSPTSPVAAPSGSMTPLVCIFTVCPSSLRQLADTHHLSLAVEGAGGRSMTNRPSVLRWRMRTLHQSSKRHAFRGASVQQSTKAPRYSRAPPSPTKLLASRVSYTVFVDSLPASQCTAASSLVVSVTTAEIAGANWFTAALLKAASQGRAIRRAEQHVWGNRS